MFKRIICMRFTGLEFEVPLGFFHFSSPYGATCREFHRPTPAELFFVVSSGWCRNPWHKNRLSNAKRWETQKMKMFLDGAWSSTIWEIKNHRNLGGCRLRGRSPKGWCFKARQILRRSPQRYWLRQMLSCSTPAFDFSGIYWFLICRNSCKSKLVTSSADPSQISRVTRVYMYGNQVPMPCFSDSCVSNHPVTCWCFWHFLRLHDMQAHTWTDEGRILNCVVKL